MNVAADITARAARVHAALVAAGRPPQGGADFLNMLQGMRRTLQAATFAAIGQLARAPREM